MTSGREGKQQGWWQSYELDYFATYVGLEKPRPGSANTSPRSCRASCRRPNMHVAMHQGASPRTSQRKESDALSRSGSAASRSSPHGTRCCGSEAIIDEAVLHRVVGGSGVMAAQLRHSSRWETCLTSRCVPYRYGAGAHPAMDNMFNILEFGDVAPASGVC